MRAALFELEFIHTDQGEAWLSKVGNQAACAKALAAGVLRHFKIRQSGMQAGAPETPTLKQEILTGLGKIRELIERI
jgi:hypothetical protein